MQNETEKIASALLGKKVSGSETYDPTLLVAIPRAENRTQYEIDNDNLPFEGFDVWHAYEFSSMTENGIPVTRLMKIRYSCENEYLVESKSLKLYLNSFNMSRFGGSIDECLTVCKKTVEKDLSEKLQTEVSVGFVENDAKRVEIFENFENIMNHVDEKNLKIEKFKEAPELIQIEEIKEHAEKHFLTFDSLRSNCRVTHQPDFGDVFIYYKSRRRIDESSLVKYLSSFRSEFHFHEECCEMIYKRLYDLLCGGIGAESTNLEEAELFVCALYTRRGGIDICPARWSKGCAVEDVFELLDTAKYARNGIKQ